MLGGEVVEWKNAQWGVVVEIFLVKPLWVECFLEKIYRMWSEAGVGFYVAAAWG
jgi:hypothetical protein